MQLGPPSPASSSPSPAFLPHPHPPTCPPATFLSQTHWKAEGLGDSPGDTPFSQITMTGSWQLRTQGRPCALELGPMVPWFCASLVLCISVFPSCMEGKEPFPPSEG